MNRFIVLALTLSALVGCDDSSQTTLGSDQGRDAAAAEDAGADATDTKGDTPKDTPDMTEMGDAALTWTALELSDGSTVQGEWIATYDSGLWWNPLPGRLFALFNRDGYAAYPDDRSLRFVRESDVVRSTDVPAPDGALTYTDFLRSEVFYLQRPPLDGTNYVITGNDTYHLEEDGFGDFAWDIVLTDDAGVRYTGDGSANEDFRVWGQTVLSMTNGVVIDVVRDSVDNLPGSHPPTDVAVNNWVGVSLGGSYYVYYLHFQNEGIDPAIEVGSLVRIGDPLGIVGNTGVSLEPHVHVVLLWYDVGAQRSYSIPIEFNNVETASSPTGPFSTEPWSSPSAGTWIR